MSQQPMSALEAVRRRPELYFQLDRNLLNQYVVGAMCLALAEVHCGSATQIRVAVDGSSFTGVIVTDTLPLAAIAPPDP